MNPEKIVIRVFENGYAVEWETREYFPLSPAITAKHAKVCADLDSLLATVREAAGKQCVA